MKTALLLLAMLAVTLTASAETPTLLDVRSATPVPPPRAAAPAGARTCRVAFDMKFTKDVAFAGWVSAGAGGTAVFGSPAANDAGDRTWALASLVVPAYGVVRYNTFGGGHLHVKHIAEAEADATLAASGRTVLAAWKAHYGRVGLPAKEYPGDQSPNAIRNSYAAKPAGLVSFQTGATGLPKGAAVNRTVEQSGKEEWKTHAWPAFAGMVAMQAPSPWPAGPVLPQLEKQASWTGPDHQATIASLMQAARAMMPKYADKIPPVPAQPLIPRYTAARAGTGWKSTGTAAPAKLGKPASLASWQRDLTVDESGQVTGDKLAITITLDSGRVEATIERAVAPVGGRNAD